MLEQVRKINVNGVDYELNLTDVVSHLTSENGTDFILKVDNDGNLFAVKSIIEDVEAGTPPTTTGTIVSFSGETKLYINSFYCGGLDTDENSLNYCSHNFVELSNLTPTDINLQGMSLQYAIDGTDWKVLPLKGIIRAGSTFLIRGAQCSMMDSPTTKIKVKSYDMEWYLGEELIKFDSSNSAKFFLCYTTEACSVTNPYDKNRSPQVNTAVTGYIDLIGVKGTKSSGGYEGVFKDSDPNTEYKAQLLSNKYLYVKYYGMDSVSAASKTIDKRKNTADWTAVDLSKDDGDILPSIEDYTPRASFEEKNIFYNKTALFEDKPSIITCSFGVNATDPGNGQGATRCFNWVVKKTGFNNLWIKADGSNSWGSPKRAFERGDGRSHHTDDWYNTKRSLYPGGLVLTAHKWIETGLAPGKYWYIAGKKNPDGTPILENCTEPQSFVVRSSSSVGSTFSFVQTSDQQGFNWTEYQVWKASSRIIMEENPSNLHFMLNTGDMTQNGNRLCEWLDYFDGKYGEMKNLEEVATIGNNDLSPGDVSVLAHVGNDIEKSNLENIDFYYTFESDDDNKPEFEIGGTMYYVPSLYSFNYGQVHFVCINTEIKQQTEEDTKHYSGTDKQLYQKIKIWCENDWNKYGKRKSDSGWNIAYCHENPFTILTTGYTNTDDATKIKERTGGCHANDNVPSSMVFWLSEFFQTHNFPVVLGGHKHTEASTWALLENVVGSGDSRTVDSIHPIIVVDGNELSEFAGSSGLTDYDGRRIPNGWMVGGSVKDEYKYKANLCTFKMRNEVTGDNVVPVVYAMSQATSYKHTSNKELPSVNIPWERYFFPCNVDDGGTASANAGQLFPFYTVWEISPSQIVGKVRKVYGVFNNKGKFYSNTEYPYVKEGYSAVEKDWQTRIHSINGITAMTNAEAETDQRTILITKSQL